MAEEKTTKFQGGKPYDKTFQTSLHDFICNRCMNIIYHDSICADCAIGDAVKMFIEDITNE